jgi:hypothetical protein
MDFLSFPWCFNLASAGLKEGRSPQDERPTPDPDLFDGGSLISRAAFCQSESLDARRPTAEPKQEVATRRNVTPDC